MRRTRQYHKRQAKAIQRRRRTTERLQRDHAQAQRAMEAWRKPCGTWASPTAWSWRSKARLRSQRQLLGKIVGVMFPSLFGCRTNAELCRVRGWDKNLPLRLLGALPKRSWLKRLRRLGGGARAAVASRYQRE